MTVCLTKLHAFDYDRQAWITGPTAAILHLADMPAMRANLADPTYRELAFTGRDPIGWEKKATADLDALEALCLAILAPAARPGCFAEPGDVLITLAG